MIALSLVTIGLQLKPPALFDAAVLARTKLQTYTAQVESDTSIQGKRDRRTYDVAYDGSHLLVRLRQPATTTIERSDRYYELTREQFVAYDAMANERLKRPDTIKGPLLTRLSGIIGPVDDSLAMVIDSGTLKGFLYKYRPFRDWRVSKVNGEIQVVRLAAGTRTAFRFDAVTSILRDIAVDVKGSHLHWAFSFRRGARVELSIPSDARLVREFSELPAPPKFASSAAEHVVEQMMKAYQKLRTAEIEVEDDGAVSHLWLNGVKLREDRTGFDWAYDGKVLTALNKKADTFYMGKAIRVTLSEFIVPMGGEVDPIMRRLLSHRTPFGELFPSNAKVSLQGTISVGGVPADVVKVTAPTTSLSLFVRTDSHLLDSVEAEVVDLSRRTMSTNTRRYKYLRLEESPPASIFSIDPGKAKQLPLPTVKGLND